MNGAGAEDTGEGASKKQQFVCTHTETYYLDRKGSRGWSKGERSTRPGPAPVPAEMDADLK